MRSVTSAGSGWSVPVPKPPPTRRRFLLGFVAILAAIVLAVGSCTVVFLLVARNANAVVEASGGRITHFSVFANGPFTTITFVAARGIDLPDGPALACKVVRPVLKRTDWAAARWTLVNRAGDVMASDQTPCQ
jgi:hypothetical protein